MARNYKKESDWANNAYTQIKFSVSKETGEVFRKHLSENKIKAIEWFQLALQSNLVSEENNTSTKMKEHVINSTNELVHLYCSKTMKDPEEARKAALETCKLMENVYNFLYSLEDEDLQALVDDTATLALKYHDAK